MENIYIDAVKYGMIEFDEIEDKGLGFGKCLTANILGSIINLPVFNESTEGFKAENILNYLTTSNLGHFVLFALRTAEMMGMSEGNINVTISSNILASDIKQLLEENPFYVEAEKAVLGIKMMLIGTGWDIDSFYHNDSDNELEIPQTLVVRFIFGGICNSDDDAFMCADGRTNIVLSRDCNADEVLKLIIEGAKSIYKEIKADKTAPKTMRNEWDFLIKRLLVMQNY